MTASSLEVKCHKNKEIWQQVISNLNSLQPVATVVRYIRLVALCY